MKRRQPEETVKPSLSPQRAIILLQQQIGKIDSLLGLSRDNPEVDKWENVTEQIIAQTFGKPHANFDAFSYAKDSGEWYTGMSDKDIQNNHVKSMEKRRKLLEGFVEQLEALAPEMPDESSTNAHEQGASTVPSKKVFIVHGHDNQARTELALILTRLGLEPIILHEQANKGMTVIEKLEEQSDNVDFAFILLTPDDFGRAKDVTAESPRARQNVVFEFGLFVGKLKRNNVCCLHKGDVESPSDLHGLVYVPFKNSIHEVQNDIVRELHAAGYQLKTDKKQCSKCGQMRLVGDIGKDGICSYCKNRPMHFG